MLSVKSGGISRTAAGVFTSISRFEYVTPFAFRTYART